MHFIPRVFAALARARTTRNASRDENSRTTGLIFPRTRILGALARR
jgi:hypothetical protein